MTASHSSATQSGHCEEMDCETCVVRPLTELANLNEAGLSVLLGSHSRLTFQPGQLLFRSGEFCRGLFIVAAGTVALRKGDGAGRSVLVRLLHAGQSLGYRSLFADEVYSCDAEAVDDVSCCFIGREAVEKIIEVSPQTAQRFLERIATDLRRAEETYMQGACLPVRARLARLLYDMRVHYGTADDQGTIRINLPLQRKDMASMLGTRPETLARTIRALGKDGVVSFDGRKVEIEDLDTLLDEFDSDGVA